MSPADPARCFFLNPFLRLQLVLPRWQCLGRRLKPSVKETLTALLMRACSGSRKSLARPKSVRFWCGGEFADVLTAAYTNTSEMTKRGKYSSAYQ